MGNTLTGEYPSTWDEPEVKDWKNTAAGQQQCAYLQFGGAQFHDITGLSKALRVTKICFAIYGPPAEDADTLEKAYTAEQRKFGTTIYEKILEVYKKAPEPKFKLGFLFIFCKEGKSTYQVPLFRLMWKETETTISSRYIDTGCRVYESANDWKEKNRLPMLKYCYPSRLFYTYKGSDSMKFDADKDVSVEYGMSPACDLVNRIVGVADVVVTVVATTVGVVSLFTPAGFISAPILLGTGITGGVYGAGRAIHRLADKASHGEAMTDLESVMLYLSILAAPLHMLSGLATARLAAGAATGRIFSQTQRVLATVLLLTTLGVDSFSFIINFANMIDKFRKDQLTPLDVLQFSVSTLFFGNTLMQPKTAWGVIQRAQQQRITTIAEHMTDDQAKSAFKTYLDDNKGTVKIGGRKGKTVLLTTSEGQTNRADANRVVRDAKIKMNEYSVSGTPKLQKPGKLRECLGGDYKDHKHLGELNEQQMRRMKHVFGASAEYNKDLVSFATKLADKMGICQDPDAFMSLVEVVAAHKKDANFNFVDSAVNSFHADVVSDLAKVRNIAGPKGLRFADPFKALYHYRKHGTEFMEMCSPKFYLGELPSYILRNGQLTDVCKVTVIAANGTTELFTQKTYFLRDDSMMVVIEKPGCNTISTIYKRPGEWTNRFRVTNLPPPEVSLGRLAFVAGVDSINMTLHANNRWHTDLEHCKNDPNYENYKIMLSMLVADFANDLDPESD
ncbi:hypothetical protein PRIPAC_93268 [Pristionchus pacificus]|uniref:DUF4781 domain-containing protein n=1 Tax=Pristionchus pacificus TaxID=54126 RepID=A0A2A6BQ71_PRIPA|nr:hypothetical protein PRIPAC_93268 [Pristionchus pacificus]|eukprot:PDM68050.1 hypothetical protein PRIPAC_46094 [Pristionchus pacificus]